METDCVRNAWACIERVIVTAIRGHERNHDGRDAGGDAMSAMRLPENALEFEFEMASRGSRQGI
jgi:hypothetical protein